MKQFIQLVVFALLGMATLTSCEKDEKRNLSDGSELVLTVDTASLSFVRIDGTWVSEEVTWDIVSYCGPLQERFTPGTTYNEDNLRFTLQLIDSVESKLKRPMEVISIEKYLSIADNPLLENKTTYHTLCKGPDNDGDPTYTTVDDSDYSLSGNIQFEFFEVHQFRGRKHKVRLVLLE